MWKTVAEVATAIGVAAAIIAGWLYAMGTVAYLEYFVALGFDAHQFPSAGLEMQVMGLAFVMKPTIYLAALIVIYAGVIVGMKRAEPWIAKWEQRLQKRLEDFRKPFRQNGG